MNPTHPKPPTLDQRHIAVIGGTGMNQWPGLVVESSQTVHTPYGVATGPVVRGQVNGRPVIFMARHGEGHKIPPHKINYRANLWALKDAGVQQVIAIAAVGAIAEWFAPGEIALPADLIDYTWGRDATYSDGSPGQPLQHVELTHPYAPSVRRGLFSAAAAADVMVSGEGTMGITQGPRLETPAEIQRLRRDGCDMVGMTGMPEAALAAELGLEYACLAVSVNWGAGIGSGGIHDEIAASIERGMLKVQATLSRYLAQASANA